LVSAIEGVTSEVLIVKLAQDAGNNCVQSDQSPQACIDGVLASDATVE
jgi:hypothetical protein